jgi:hypothetical protein
MDIAPGDYVQHQAGWTGVVLAVETLCWGRAVQVVRDDGKGEMTWWRYDVFTLAGNDG